MRRIRGILVVALAAAALIAWTAQPRGGAHRAGSEAAFEAAGAVDQVEQADQVTPGTFNGSFDPSGACGADPFAVAAGTTTIDVAVNATLPTNDIALTLLDPSGTTVASSDAGTSPEAVHYVSGAIAAGTWTARVCPSPNPAGPFLQPYSYTGVYTLSDAPLAGVPVVGGSITPTQGGSAGTPTPSYAAGTLRFSPETVIDPQRTEGEPLNFVAPDGTYWESGPFGTSSQQSWVHRSTDGGLEFHELSPLGLRPDAPPGGGDTDVVVDDQGFGYFSDLEGLVNVSVAVSNDGGNTWRKNALSSQEVGVDRQWLAVDDGTTPGASDNTVFLTYRQVPLGPQVLSTPGSTGAGDPTGGLVWTNAASATGQVAVSSGAPCGKLIFDQVARNLYLPCGQGDHIELVVGHVAPGQRSGIDFHDVELPASPGGGDVATIFPWVAADQAGDVMAVWIDGNDRNVYESTSTDHGTTWTTPVKVNTAPSTTNVFPQVAGGPAGAFALGWYGSESSTDSDSQVPGTDPSAPPWYGYAAVVTHADTLHPTIAQQRFTAHPMHYGQICTGGTTCTGDRTMADFFDVALDGNGAIRLVFNDESSQFRAAHLMEVRQLTGAAPASPMSDPTGDAHVPQYAPGGPGPNLPQLDFTKLALSRPGTGVLRVQMTLASLKDLTPPAGKSSVVWLTRFQAHSTTSAGGDAYRIFYVGAKAAAGGTPTFFAGSPESTTGCLNTSSGCKVLIYPAQQALTSGSVSGDTITIDVSLDQGFGGAKVDGSTLYGVTALSYGENGDADLYAEGDATHSFDYGLGATPPSVPQPTSPPAGKGKGGSGGSQPTPPPGQALPPETVPGAGLGGVAGTRTARHRLVRAQGVVRGKGGAGGVVFRVDLSRGPGRKVVVVDALRHLRFRSLRLAPVRFGAHSARLSGTGLLNGRRVRFAAVAVDRGSRGDVFRIAWLHHASIGGVLESGNVLVR